MLLFSLDLCFMPVQNVKMTFLYFFFGETFNYYSMCYRTHFLSMKYVPLFLLNEREENNHSNNSLKHACTISLSTHHNHNKELWHIIFRYFVNFHMPFLIGLIALLAKKKKKHSEGHINF